MAVTKIAISLDPKLAAEIRQAAAAEGTTVSGWLTHAALIQLQSCRLGHWLDDFEREHGAPTKEMMEAAERAWPA